MNYLEYIEKLTLPTNMHDEVFKSLGNQDRFPYKNDMYKAFDATDKLKQFTQSIFDFKIDTMVHVLYSDIPIHKDVFRTKAYNYIIDTGGSDVETCFYNEEFELVQSYKIEPLKWHFLNVEVNHNVINIKHPRIAITIFHSDEIPHDHRV